MLIRTLDKVELELLVRLKVREMDEFDTFGMERNQQLKRVAPKAAAQVVTGVHNSD